MVEQMKLRAGNIQAGFGDGPLSKTQGAYMPGKNLVCEIKLLAPLANLSYPGLFLDTFLIPIS
jgi:hypothetical protein